MAPVRSLFALLLGAAYAATAAAEAAAPLRARAPMPLGAALARSLDRLRASASADDGRVPRAERAFLINGWHWHNLIVEMHMRSLADALHAEPRPSAAAVRRAWAYLWEFSALSLHRTEGSLFLPWVRAQVPAGERPAVVRLEALAAAERERGRALGARVRALGHGAEPLPARAAARLRSELVALSAAQAAKHAHAVSIAVPLVAAHCTAAEQGRFNQQVLQSLGIAGARLHLVAMAEVCQRSAATAPARGGRAAASLAALLGGGRRAAAAVALGGGGRARVGYGLDGDQRALFRARIPWVARRMLPRWRALYEAKAGPLLCREPSRG